MRQGRPAASERIDVLGIPRQLRGLMTSPWVHREHAPVVPLAEEHCVVPAIAPRHLERRDAEALEVLPEQLLAPLDELRPMELALRRGSDSDPFIASLKWRCCLRQCRRQTVPQFAQVCELRLQVVNDPLQRRPL